MGWGNKQHYYVTPMHLAHFSYLLKGGLVPIVYLITYDLSTTLAHDQKVGLEIDDRWFKP